MMKIHFDPARREMRDGYVELTAEEARDLARATLICMRVEDNEFAADFFRALNLPASIVMACALCNAPIHVRPWATIAHTKICLQCSPGWLENREMEAS